MSEGQIRKPDKDFSKEVDKQLPEAEEQAKVYLIAEDLLYNVANIFVLADKCAGGDREAYGVGKANETGEPNTRSSPLPSNHLGRHQILHQHLELS